MPAKISEAIRKQTIELYASGLSSTEISVRLNVSPAWVCSVARGAGLSRNQSEAKKAQYKMRPKASEKAAPGVIYGSSQEKKECPTCSRALPATTEYFYSRKRANGRTYLSSSCRECVKSQRSAYRKSNPEKVKESYRRTAEKNGEKYNETRRIKIANNADLRAEKNAKSMLWYKRNKDYVRLYRKLYADENAELISRQKIRYREANRDKVRARSKIRKALVRCANGSFNQEDLDTRYKAQGGKCFWCKCELHGKYHADHFIALAQGGTNHPWNIVLACGPCNTSKGSKLPNEFFVHMKKCELAADKVAKRRAYMAAYMRERRGKLKADVPT